MAPEAEGGSKMKCLIRYCLALFVLMFVASPAFAQKVKDVERGHYVDALLRESFQVLDDEELTRCVSEIGQKIVAASGNPHGFQFRFTIINDASPNAFATAGGYVYVTTGLLRTIESEDELASVLSHEIGHINERHGMSTGMGKKGVSLVIGIYIGSEIATGYVGSWVQNALAPYVMDYATASSLERLAGVSQALTNMAVSRVGQVALQKVYRGYREGMEFKSDELALSYMTKAGYKVEALVTVFGRMLKLGEAERAGRSITYLHSSHAMLEKRTKKVKEVIARANQR